MITGLELFFAVAPLIIAGTEPYRKLYDKARTLSLRKHKNDQHMDFLRNLQHEVALLQLALISLVTSLPGLSVIDKQRLLDHKELHYGQEDSIWNDESVQEALRTHLHEAFSAVSDCLSTILKNLDNLISDRSTGLHKVDLCQVQSDKIHEKLYALRKDGEKNSFQERFQFTKNEKSRAYALLRITENNAKLQKLVSQATKTSAGAKIVIRSRNAPHKGYSRVMNSLYNALASCWTCRCDHPHEARVCLLKSEHSRSEAAVASLDMLMSIRKDNGTKGNWQESNIRITVEERRDRSPSVAIQVADAAQSTARDDIKALGGLCKVISEERWRPHSLGLDFEGDGRLWKDKRLRRPSMSLNDIQDPDVGTSLKEILDRSSKLSLKERRRLAVVLAHAVLHFCGGPWLNENWDKDNVSFFPQTKAGNGVADLSRPYLSAKFTNDDDSEEDPASLTHHEYPTILGLGVLLLELDLCGSIEERYAENEKVNGAANANTKLTTAERLFEESVDQMYVRYRAAIDACLNCNWVMDDKGLMIEDEALRTEMYHRIVAPLEEELETGWKIKPEALALVF